MLLETRLLMIGLAALSISCSFFIASVSIAILVKVF